MAVTWTPTPWILPNGWNSKMWSERSRTFNDGVSLVQQHFKDEVDINTIVRRFGMTGEMPFGAAAGVYGDFTEVTDFASAKERIMRAEAGFMKLPADVRERFGNDPGAMVQFAQERGEDEFASLFVKAPVREPESGGSPPVV